MTHYDVIFQQVEEEKRIFEEKVAKEKLEAKDENIKDKSRQEIAELKKKQEEQVRQQQEEKERKERDEIERIKQAELDKIREEKERK